VFDFFIIMATDGIYERLSEVELPLEVCQPVKHEPPPDAFAQEQLDGLKALARLSATAVTDHDNWAPQSARATWPDDSRHPTHSGHSAHSGHTAHGAHGAGSAGAGRDTGGFLRSDFLRHDRDWDPPLLRRAAPAPEF
jgi:hypothetical protein